MTENIILYSGMQLVQLSCIS